VTEPIKHYMTEPDKPYGLLGMNGMNGPVEEDVEADASMLPPLKARL
jgi:hypothetical protein